jgi:hypothetical protein
METGIKSSFIPQAPMTPSNIDNHRSGGGMGLLTLISIVLLVASITLAVGVFLYVQFLQTSASSKLEQLERAKQAFEPSLIQDLTRLDDRMRAADVILDEHIAPSALFTLLQQLTLQTVSFSTLDLTESADTVTITMKGVAQSVNSIALQADLLAKSGVIASPIFSNINRQLDGVHFDFTAEVNRAALHYAPLGGQAAQQDVSAIQEVQQSTSPFGTPGEGGTASTTPTP